MKHWIRKKWPKVQKCISFLLVIVVFLTGIPFPVRAGKVYGDYLDGWKIKCAWSTLSQDYAWNAAKEEVRQPKMVVTYRLEQASRAYAPGDIQFEIDGIGGINRKEILKASELASDQVNSEWDCVWDKETDVYTFSNRFSVEEGQSVSGGFQLLWTLYTRDSVHGYEKEITPVFKIRGTGEIETEPLKFQYHSVPDHYRIYLKKNKITAEDYLTSDQNYIWYEIETRFDKEWLARGLKLSNYYIAVELPAGKDYSSVMAKTEGKTVPLEEIQTESGAVVWEFYPFKNRAGDLGKYYETFYNKIQLGFLKNHFSDGDETYKMVTVRGHLDRLYYDDSVWVTTAGEKEKVDDQLQFTVSDYSFSYAGYIYSNEKTSDYENYPYDHNAPSSYSSRLNATRIYNGTIVNFWLKGDAKKTYEEKKQFRSMIKSQENISEEETATPSNSNVDIEEPSDWNDINWKEHGLLEEKSWWEETGVLYGELYPEKISESAMEKATSSNSNWILEEEENVLSFLGGLFLNLGRKLMPKKVYASEYMGLESATPSEEAAKTPMAVATVSEDKIQSESERLINPEEEYSFVLGDDKLAVFLTDGTVRNLTDKEYDIVSILIPKRKENYEYEVFGAPSQDTPFEEYRFMGKGVMEKEHSLTLPDGVKSVFLRINHVKENISMKVRVSVRLHLDWEEQKSLEEQGKPVPDHENHLINFSYIRSLYRDQDGYEVNDCSADAENYMGTYGKELAERDQAVYGEYLQRTYANVWLRSPVTNLESSTYMDPLEGNQRDGFYANAVAVGRIKTDDKIALKCFSLYAELQEGMKFVLYPDDIKATGTGKFLSGGEAKNVDFNEYVSYSIRKIDGKNLLAADFDFTDSPLDASEYLEVKVFFKANLENTDFISYGNQYKIYSYVMVHDEGLDKITGKNIKTDRDDINGNGSVSEKMVYSSDRENVYDTASEWREYVSKQVKSAYSSKYDTEAVTSILDGTDKSKYSYRLEFGLGSNHAKNIDFFDRIEQGALVALNETNPTEYTEIPSEWRGKFLSVDTSYAEQMKMKPTIYYSTNENQKLVADALEWSTVIPDNPEDVKAVWIHLDTSGMENGLMKTRQKIYVLLHMEAPDDKAYIKKTAVNQYYVQYDAYGISGIDDFESRYELPSGATKVQLLDTVGSMVFQKSDGDHQVGIYQDGRKKYAPLKGARFQIYNEHGQPLFEKDGRMVNALGQLELSGIPFGTYYWEEIAAPLGYRKIEGRHLFTISSLNGTMEIPNNRIKGEVILTKYDRDNEKTPPLEGAEFELFSSDGEQMLFTETGRCSKDGSYKIMRTGKDGTLKITELPWGEYYMVEIKPPVGYEKMDTPIYFSIRKNDVSEKDGKLQLSVALKAYNDQKTSSLRLKKTDEKNGNPLKDAVFSLYRKADAEGKEDILIQSSLRTDEAGEVQVDNLLFGTYYFVETKNPPGYQLTDKQSERSDTVTVDASMAGQVLEITKTNQPMTGTVTLMKKNDQGQVLPGAEYRLFYRMDPKRNYEDQGKLFVTDEKGEIRISGLSWGEYYFQETKAPYGYILSPEKLYFKVDKTTVQSEIDLHAVNQRKKGKIRLVKCDRKFPQKLLPGAEYELYKADGTKCLPGIDYVLTEGEGQILTGIDGSVMVSQISQGIYYLKEKKAPPGYNISDEKLYFSVTAESVESVQEIIAEDERSRGRIRINKIVNEVYEPFGTPAFIYRILKKDGKTKEPVQTLYKIISVPSGQTEESMEISVEQGYLYEIEELEGARYRLTEIMPKKENVFVNGRKALIDLNHYDYGEVAFRNEITQYEKLSHTSHVINMVKKRKRQ